MLFEVTFRQRRLSVGAALLIASTAALAGCSGAVTQSEGWAPITNHGCVDDSKTCIEQRQATLRSLQADKSRSWVRQPANVNAYATGVRLFAYKTEKTRMTCDELGIGRREADGAPSVLRSPQATGLNPAIVSRGLMFATEVSRELTREQQQRRCVG